MPPLRIALLGAESTGKTTLAQGLAAHWQAQGHPVSLVPEVQRAWCEREGHPPPAKDYAPIAREQQRLAEAAPAGHWVVADTTPLMVAAYADLVFGDRSLYAEALAHQSSYHVTLLMGLDLPWMADGLREGPHSQEPADAALRSALRGAGLAFAVVHGRGPQRLANALKAVNAAFAINPIAASAGGTGAAGPYRSKNPWHWACEKCSDPACERRLFTGLPH